jgi:hypothetical protein
MVSKKVETANGIHACAAGRVLVQAGHILIRSCPTVQDIAEVARLMQKAQDELKKIGTHFKFGKVL